VARNYSRTGTAALGQYDETVKSGLERYKGFKAFKEYKGALYIF